MNINHKKIKKAFSLIELSIAILIIGIIIVGVFAGTLLIKKSQIKTAQVITESSPVNSIKDLSLWLESSSESSFEALEADNGNAISIWHDRSAINANKSNASQSASDNKPSFSNSIAKIHAVAFDGTDDYLEVDGSFLNENDYTICVTEKRTSNKSDNYFIGDDSDDTENESILLGYSANGSIIFSQGGSNILTASVENYSGGNKEPRYICFTQKSSTGKTIHINGMLAASSSNNTKLSNIGNIRIGDEYQGEIGEIIGFARGIKTEERQSIESYLGKKWQIASHIGQSCTNGAVTSGGCDINVCSVSVTGSSTASVSEGSSTISCNSTGYSGTVSYTCTDGALNTSGTCGCASGYLSVDGTCQQDCSVSIDGSSTTNVNTGSGSISCNSSGYTGSVSYTCSNGSLETTGSCSCATGFELISGTCQAITCNFSSYTGMDDVTGLAYSSSSVARSCDADGYNGTINYTCTTTGAANVVSGSCVVSTGCDNGAGGTFDKTGLSTSQQYALAACESHYGSGNCELGTCVGANFYHRSSAGYECTCNYPQGDYEWVFSNTSGQVGGGGWGGQTTSTVGAEPFVRLKGSNTCSSTAWGLVLSNFGSDC